MQAEGRKNREGVVAGTKAANANADATIATKRLHVTAATQKANGEQGRGERTKDRLNEPLRTHIHSGRVNQRSRSRSR